MAAAAIAARQELPPQAGLDRRCQQRQPPGALRRRGERGEGAAGVGGVVGEAAAGRAAVAHGGGEGAADVGGAGEGLVVLVVGDAGEPVPHLGETGGRGCDSETRMNGR